MLSVLHPRARERLRSIVMVCLSVCLSVREDISGTRSLTNFCVHVAYVRGSVLLRMLTTGGRIACGREGSDGRAQRGRNVIYDCLVVTVKSSFPFLKLPLN